MRDCWPNAFLITYNALLFRGRCEGREICDTLWLPWIPCGLCSPYWSNRKGRGKTNCTLSSLPQMLDLQRISSAYLRKLDRRSVLIWLQWGVVCLLLCQVSWLAWIFLDTHAHTHVHTCRGVYMYECVNLITKTDCFNEYQPTRSWGFSRSWEGSW